MRAGDFSTNLVNESAGIPGSKTCAPPGVSARRGRPRMLPHRGLACVSYQTPKLRPSPSGACFVDSFAGRFDAISSKNASYFTNLCIKKVGRPDGLLVTHFRASVMCICEFLVVTDARTIPNVEPCWAIIFCNLNARRKHLTSLHPSPNTAVTFHSPGVTLTQGEPISPTYLMEQACN